MSNVELVTGYRDIVFSIHTLKVQRAWNERHGLPVDNLTVKIRQLVQELIRFVELLDTITDRRARNIICLRFVLGMSERDTAYSMNISRVTVNRICANTLRNLESVPPVPPPYAK